MGHLDRPLDRQDALDEMAILQIVAFCLSNDEAEVSKGDDQSKPHFECPCRMRMFHYEQLPLRKALPNFENRFIKSGCCLLDVQSSRSYTPGM